MQQEVTLARELTFWCGSIAFNLLELAQTSSFYIRSGVGWTLIPFRHGHLWPDKSYEGRAVGAHGSRDNANRVLLLEAPRSDEIVVDQGPVADRLTGFAKIAS